MQGLAMNAILVVQKIIDYVAFYLQIYNRRL